MGNLAYTTTRDALVDLFQQAGNVVDAHLPSDRETGKPRGFAFVEFETEEEAQKAIETFEGKDLEGRALRVNLAEERKPRSGGPRGGGPPRMDMGGFDGGGFDGGGFEGGGGRGGRPSKPKGSRRGARGRKRSLN